MLRNKRLVGDTRDQRRPEGSCSCPCVAPPGCDQGHWSGIEMQVPQCSSGDKHMQIITHPRESLKTTLFLGNLPKASTATEKLLSY